MFVDHGRPMPDGPALLKTRREMRYEDAASLWFQLKSLGWTLAKPDWDRRTWEAEEMEEDQRRAAQEEGDDPRLWVDDEEI